jgi:hypothetical protein
MPQDLSSALVSFWAERDRSSEDAYLGGGVFIADNLILTAAHVVPTDPEKVWVRVEASGTLGKSIDGRVDRHPELDVALVRLRTPMPAAARALACDVETRYDRPLHEFQLCGYFEGKLEQPHPLTVTCFDDEEQHYLSTLKQPCGHSGSPVCHGPRVWGVAIRHYTDGNVHRGCIVALAQVRAWLEPLLAECGVGLSSHEAPAAAHALAGKFLGRLQHQLATLHASHPALADVDDDGLLAGLRDALQSAKERRQAADGRECVDRLMKLTRRITEALDEPPLDTLPRAERAALRRRLKCAMGSAAKLCLEPSGLAAGFANVALLEIPADTAHGATLVMREEPDRNWVYEIRGGLPRVRDQHALELPIELGEGEDARRELARAIHASVSPTGETPKEISQALMDQIGGLAHSEAAEGRARYLVLGRSETAKLPQDTRQWLRDRLHVDTLQLAGANGRLFVYPENLLFGRLQEFLKLLDRPEWKA